MVTAEGWPAALAARPVCPRRQLPIPYIAEVDPVTGEGHFTVLDDDRKAECLAGRLCAMCGTRMGLVTLVGDGVSLDQGGFYIEPPVHERCALIAAGGLCPFLSHERVPRRPLPDGVKVVGAERTHLAEVGTPARPKRPVVMAVCRTYEPVLVPTDVPGQVVMAYVPRSIIRVRRFRWDGDRAVETVTSPPATYRRVQPRRKPRSRR